MLGLLLLMLELEVVARIRVSCTTILDLQNSRESPNSWNCRNPKTCWSRGVPRNCGTQKHIGMAASHGTAQFRSNPVPTKGFGPGGSHGAFGAGAGQQVKPRTCKARGGWVGGITDGHKATSQQNPLKDFRQHLARPVSTGGHTTLRPCGVPIGWQSSNPDKM